MQLAVRVVLAPGERKTQGARARERERERASVRERASEIQRDVSHI